METEKFALIAGLVLIVVLALVAGAKKFLQAYAPTTETTKDDEWIPRLQKMEDILTGIQAGTTTVTTKAEEPAKPE
jgi:hypothetical protein